jgi:hypothetical protein
MIWTMESGWPAKNEFLNTRPLAPSLVSRQQNEWKPMAKEEIEIEISPSGKVTARTIGIKGPRCLDVAEMLARVVGKEESRTLTSEYYEAETHVQDQIQIHQRRY